MRGHDVYHQSVLSEASHEHEHLSTQALEDTGPQGKFRKASPVTACFLRATEKPKPKTLPNPWKCRELFEISIILLEPPRDSPSMS